MTGPIYYANPACFRCKGSGFDTVADMDCSCVRDARLDDIRTEHYLPNPVLSESAKTRLEASIRRELVKARARYFESSARTLASLAARGKTPPSVEKLAAFAHVDEDVAARVLDQIRGAFQTKKKRRAQCPDPR